MATHTLHTTTVRLPRGLSMRWHSLQAAWARHTRYRATYNELQALTDRDLADLGISRAMISSMAWEASAEA